jgi:hypothetical protein
MFAKPREDGGLNVSELPPDDTERDARPRGLSHGAQGEISI